MLVLIGWIAVGCNRPAHRRRVPPRPRQSRPSDKLPDLQCDLSVVASLVPQRITHVTIDPYSNIYFLQESDDGKDAMFVIGSENISSITPLSSAAILEAMNEQGSGNIQSIGAAADGNVYFYFSGGTLKKTVACAGRYEPRGGAIRILAKQDQLAAVSGMHESLTFARQRGLGRQNCLALASPQRRLGPFQSSPRRFSAHELDATPAATAQRTTARST